MQTFIINNQEIIPLPIAAKALGVARQEIHSICKTYGFQKIYYSPMRAGITVSDFNEIKLLPRKVGRPYKK